MWCCYQQRVPRGVRHLCLAALVWRGFVLHCSDALGGAPLAHQGARRSPTHSALVFLGRRDGGAAGWAKRGRKRGGEKERTTHGTVLMRGSYSQPVSCEGKAQVWCAFNNLKICIVFALRTQLAGLEGHTRHQESSTGKEGQCLLSHHYYLLYRPHPLPPRVSVSGKEPPGLIFSVCVFFSFLFSLPIKLAHPTLL